MFRSFLTGFVGYPLLEVLYRGRTHYSMAFAGGMAMCLIRFASRTAYPLPVKAFVCGTGITGIELLCGTLWNRSYAVWDYRQLPLNYRGQICLPYSLLWCALSAGALAILQHHKKPAVR